MRSECTDGSRYYCTASAEYQGGKDERRRKNECKARVKRRMGGKQKITAARGSTQGPEMGEVDIRQKGLIKKDGFLISSRFVLPLQFWGSLCPSKGVAGINALVVIGNLKRTGYQDGNLPTTTLDTRDVTPCGEVYGECGGKLRRTRLGIWGAMQ
jgi:hypothetical protein